MLEHKTFSSGNQHPLNHEPRILSGGICFGLHSKDDLNFALKTTLCVGFSWFQPSFSTHCGQSLVRLSSNGGSSESDRGFSNLVDGSST